MCGRPCRHTAPQLTAARTRHSPRCSRKRGSGAQAAASRSSLIKILKVRHAAGVSMHSNPIPLRAKKNIKFCGGIMGLKPHPKMMISGCLTTRFSIMHSFKSADPIKPMSRLTSSRNSITFSVIFSSPIHISPLLIWRIVRVECFD